MTEREHKYTAVAFLLIACCSVALSLFLITPDYWIDDSFIGFRYARNLDAGHGLVFNPGERVEGYTSYLWVLISYLGVVAGNPMIFVQIVGVISQILTLYFLFLIGETFVSHRKRALLAPALLAYQITFIIYPMTGMDTSFFSMLITLAVLIYVKEKHKSTAGEWLIGCILLAIALTRFDGLGMVGIILFYKVFIDKEFKESIPAILVVGVGLLLYNAWRLNFYPGLLPNTFYAKVGFITQQIRGGFKYLAIFFSRGGHFVLLLGVLPFLLKRANKKLLFVGWVVLMHLVYVGVIGGDWMPYYRFLLPVLPLLYLLLQQGLWLVSDKIRETVQVQGKVVARGVIGVVFILNLASLYQGRNFNNDISGKIFHPLEAKKIGEAASRAFPADWVVAIEWAGIIPYYLRQPVLDIFGLNDQDIIEQEFPGGRMGRSITPEYLFKRNPAAVVICARTFPTLGDARQAANIRVEESPPGSRLQVLYGSMRAPESPYRACILKIDDDSFWPCLVRRDLPHLESICTEEAVFGTM